MDLILSSVLPPFARRIGLTVSAVYTHWWWGGFDAVRINNIPAFINSSFLPNRRSAQDLELKTRGFYALQHPARMKP